jgi:hypothetical protein
MERGSHRITRAWDKVKSANQDRIGIQSVSPALCRGKQMETRRENILVKSRVGSCRTLTVPRFDLGAGRDRKIARSLALTLTYRWRH